MYWNRAAEEMYGWSELEAMGRNFAEMVPFEKPMDEQLEIYAPLQRGESWAGDLWVTRRDGVRVPTYISDTPVFGPDGEMVAVIGVSIDITERMAGESARRQLSAIVTGSGDAIFGLTLEGRVTSWNAGAQALFGYDAAEILGQPITVLTPADERWPAMRGARSRRARLHDSFEAVRMRKDGTLVDVIITSAPATDDDGAVVGRFGHRARHHRSQGDTARARSEPVAPRRGATHRARRQLRARHGLGGHDVVGGALPDTRARSRPRADDRPDGLDGASR